MKMFPRQLEKRFIGNELFICLGENSSEAPLYTNVKITNNREIHGICRLVT